VRRHLRDQNMHCTSEIKGHVALHVLCYGSTGHCQNPFTSLGDTCLRLCLFLSFFLSFWFILWCRKYQDFIVSDGKVRDDWGIGKDLEENCGCEIEVLPGAWLEGLRKLNKDNRSPGRDSNRSLPEYISATRVCSVKTKLHGFSQQANYTDRATAAFRRS
jgi:hypothetical protein